LILVDTSIWADHFRRNDPLLALMLAEGRVLTHDFIIGELALGNLPDRIATIAALRDLPHVPVLSLNAFLAGCLSEDLVAAGIGFVDAHLLLSVRREPGLRLWSRDKKLAAKADAGGVAWAPPAF
jgi:predicted nucleic acid-binding protein